MDSELVRLAAFSAGGRGGNPAGVWLGAELPSVDEMQRIAAEVGYSETAFSQRIDDRRWLTRYYSPQAEVSFCGHATIATGVALGERFGVGSFRLDTAVGAVDVAVDAAGDAALRATLTSVRPDTRPLPDGLLSAALHTMGWSAEVLDPAIPAGLAYAGAWHLVVPLASRARLAELSYDFDRLRELMAAHDLTTVQVLHRETDTVFHARNPFPVGGVVEDPATGAAAAAFGAYLRECGLIAAPATFTIHQGYDMGRPSDIFVDVPASGGIRVSGSATLIAGRDREGALEQAE